MPNSIDINTLNQLLAAGDAPLLLDVRRKADYAAMPQIIEGARWWDPESIDTWSKALPAGRPIVVYCVKGGSVSQSVVNRLHKEGHDAVWVEGGLKAWIESGQPIIN
ncbi:rhodanese-like domain-containing protein [uncultured Desulfosarcina sp.]|uniref:rhodanese-like domain-containing protein n=1 Tax=uncultured Desulfosarcina sp. TaxID=218289 RepID=UPI0029C6D719|nr:rhodanese-like domain-containing protein [uncultured Desulfosarcina sp.]